MPIVRKSILISAPIEKVFGVVADVEDIARFSSSIVEISRMSDNNYYWRIELAGIALEWNAAVTRKDPPNYLSWHSVKGVESRGEYLLAAQDGQTRVDFMMEYHLPLRLIEKALHAFIGALIEDNMAEVLANIRKELEQ